MASAATLPLELVRRENVRHPEFYPVIARCIEEDERQRRADWEQDEHTTGGNKMERPYQVGIAEKARGKEEERRRIWRERRCLPRTPERHRETAELVWNLEQYL